MITIWSDRATELINNKAPVLKSNFITLLCGIYMNIILKTSNMVMHNVIDTPLHIKCDKLVFKSTHIEIINKSRI